jgi:hypothetical protein
VPQSREADPHENVSGTYYFVQPRRFSLLTGIAGASATLQAIFGLQESYVRDAVDALDLLNLKAKLESDKEAAKGQDYEKYAALQVALSSATKTYREIIIGRQRAYFEHILPGGDR